MIILGVESGKNSSLHVSHDYGRNFTMVTLNVSDTKVAQVDYFVKGPVTYQLVRVNTENLYVYSIKIIINRNQHVEFVITVDVCINV